MMHILQYFFILLTKLILHFVKLLLNLLFICEPLLVKCLLFRKKHIKLLFQHLILRYSPVHFK
jgi:hypothetical protein